jgi:hypothetical protein
MRGPADPRARSDLKLGFFSRLQGREADRCGIIPHLNGHQARIIEAQISLAGERMACARTASMTLTRRFCRCAANHDPTNSADFNNSRSRCVTRVIAL